MEIILAIFIFILLMFLFKIVFSALEKSGSRSVRKAVERYAVDDSDVLLDIDIRYQRKLSDINVLNAILSHLPFVLRIDNIIQQSGVRMLADAFIVISLLSGFLAAIVVKIWSRNNFLAGVVALLCLLLPYLWLLYRRQQRLARFEELFPDALDLMGYSLRAGHSIMAGLKMVADESPEPIKSEFSRMVEEINFGNGVDSALRGFARRIGIPEAKFFATCIIIQRETGGNLAELLDKVSSIIRARFRFRERVRTLAAEGKISAIILTGLPFCIAFMIYLTNRKYLSVLFHDPAGPYLIGIALLMMCMGIFIMNRLIRIDL